MPSPKARELADKLLSKVDFLYGSFEPGAEELIDAAVRELVEAMQEIASGDYDRTYCVLKARAALEGWRTK